MDTGLDLCYDLMYILGLSTMFRPFVTYSGTIYAHLYIRRQSEEASSSLRLVHILFTSSFFPYLESSVKRITRSQTRPPSRRLQESG